MPGQFPSLGPDVLGLLGPELCYRHSQVGFSPETIDKRLIMTSPFTHLARVWLEDNAAADWFTAPTPLRKPQHKDRGHYLNMRMVISGHHMRHVTSFVIRHLYSSED